ncbi:hypothetical protein ACJJTC_001645 [Scirpophaga incertulas]
MIGIASALVIATVFQVISCQGPPPPPPPPFPPNVPPQCRGPPQGVEKPHECCKIPPFFTDEDFEECGFKKIDNETERRHGPPDCTKQLCLMKKYSLVKDETELDHEAVSAFVDKWADANAEFKPAMAKAKDQCIGKPLPGPPHLCEANKIVFCMTHKLFSECPTWEETEGCQKLKAHIEECSQYFPKQ